MDKKEYIERDALIQKIMASRDNNPHSDPDIELHHHVEHNKFIAIAAHQPAVDVVEIVRCKDCAVPHNRWTGCPMIGGLVTPDDFYCAFGEEKEK